MKVERERGDFTFADRMNRFCLMVLPSDEMRSLMETVMMPSVRGFLTGFMVALGVVGLDEVCPCEGSLVGCDSSE